MALPSLVFFLFFSFVSMPVWAEWKAEKHSFKTPDGISIVSDFSTAEKGKPTLVLLHGLGSAKYEWKALAERMASHGWGIMAYDARGHGDSAGDYKNFGRPGRGSQWEKMINDVGAVLLNLEKEKGVSRNQVFLCGASLGANVSLAYASLTRKVKGVVLLSPGWDYQGIRTEAAVRRAKDLPLLIIASPKDLYAYRSSLKLKEINPSITLWTDVPDGHGVQMFDDVLLSRISEWLREKN